MHNLKVAAVALALCAAGAAGAQAQSFSCGGKLTHTEAAICDNPTLGELDEQVAARYYEIISSVGPRERKRIKREQKAWLRDRDTCGANVDCLIAYYTSRRDELHAYGD